MQPFPLSPVAMLASIREHRGLLWALMKREVIGRYRGSIMGIFWSFLLPLLMLAVYTFVFSVIFNARWNTGNADSGSRTEFALVLFAGLLVFNFFSECINRAPGLILANTNYVKKVVFPLEILPLVIVGAALFHGVISWLVWLIFYAIFFGVPPLTIVLFPLVVFPFILLTMGVCWFLASLGVYLRDIAQVVGVLTTVLLFMSPIFYPVTALPARVQKAILLNPLTTFIEHTRDVLIWGKTPSLPWFAVVLLIGALSAWAGFWWFQKTRKGFADVL